MANTTWRRLRFCAFAFVALLAACIALEHVLELRDSRLMTANDTFSYTHGKRIRYRLMGKSNPGPVVVLSSGLSGAIEQWDDVQRQLSKSVLDMQAQARAALERACAVSLGHIPRAGMTTSVARRLLVFRPTRQRLPQR
jgi:hypothetical protein